MADVRGWLPPGLFTYGAELAAEVDRRLGATGAVGTRVGIVGDAARWLEMPRRLGLVALTDTPDQPVLWGDGALCVDLGPDDHETWQRFAALYGHEPGDETGKKPGNQPSKTTAGTTNAETAGDGPGKSLRRTAGYGSGNEPGDRTRNEWDRQAGLESCPEAVAVAAQEWRLAVTPYRKLCRYTSREPHREPNVEPYRQLDRESPALSALHVQPEPYAQHGSCALPATSNSALGGNSSDGVASVSVASDSTATDSVSSVDGLQILDMTSMWAGPLCTELLGRAGACVRKVSSAARPDGLADTPMFAELNAHKIAVKLDPRQPLGRRCLDELLATTDLLVTSLSPRALANLELLPSQLAALHPHLCTLAITAFEPDSPERDWIAYGTGVHAASGLGWLGDHPQAPAYSYPDPLAGLLAARVAADQLAGVAQQHESVSLAGAIAPLVARAARGSATAATTAPAGSRRD